MKPLIFGLAGLVIMLSSCSQSKDKNVKDSLINTAKILKDEQPGKVLEDFGTWWEYNYRNIELYKDFVALDTDSTVISKEKFYKALTSGDLIPFKLTSKSTPHYMLYKIKPAAKEAFYGSLKQWGDTQYKYFLMEGKKLPPYHFVDINGKAYPASYTEGKVVAIKCWFISCSPCVKEIPALNTIVQNYKGRNDILFLGLAFDTKAQLKQFAKNTQFDYALVPDQETYMNEVLKISGYPTHIILNKKGEVVKVVDNDRELEYVLNTLI